MTEAEERLRELGLTLNSIGYIRQKACLRKRNRFRTFREARLLMAGLRHRADPEAELLRAYRCGFCGAVHVGHDRGRTRPEIAGAIRIGASYSLDDLCAPGSPCEGEPDPRVVGRKGRERAARCREDGLAKTALNNQRQAERSARVKAFKARQHSRYLNSVAALHRLPREEREAYRAEIARWENEGGF